MISDTGLRIPESKDIPAFAGTEDAVRFGRELRRVLAPDEFQTLVRTWITTQRAAALAIDQQSKVVLATRSGKLREAVEEFLFPSLRKPLSSVSSASSAVEILEGAT